ncbi:MAG: hypothetical protein ACRDMV_11715 [Streptosporangiales bacterium]
MLRRGIYFGAMLLSACTMGLEFAHVLEWQPKTHYPAALYVRLQESLYIWFGNVGSVIYVLAIVASVALAVALRKERSSRGLVTAAAALEVIALITFLTIVYPVNLQFPVHGSGAVPAGWAALRDRWELGHAVGFALFTAAFILLAVNLLRTPAREPVR